MNIDQEVFASLPPRVQMEIIADIRRFKQAKTKALVRDGSFKTPVSPRIRQLINCCVNININTNILYRVPRTSQRYRFRI